MLKILHIDCETAPKLAYVWRMWKENINPFFMENDWFMLTWSASWEDEETVYGHRLTVKEVILQDDKRLLQELWELLDEADVVVAHNGDKFDIPSINTRFIANEIAPPSPYKSVDTLKVAKKKFKFSSNRLDYLGEFLGCGRKIDTGGMELWVDCMAGKEDALIAMLEYNKQDVKLLKSVYRKLLPYIPSHPNHSLINEGEHKCPRCASTNVTKQGFAYTNMSTFQQYKCKDCGGWSRGRTNVRSKEEMKATLLPV